MEQASGSIVVCITTALVWHNVMLVLRIGDRSTPAQDLFKSLPPQESS